jgi:hypothetical protein
MMRLTSMGNSRRWQWFYFVILFAAISLTVSVVTRYTFSVSANSQTAVTAHRSSSCNHGRQRLLNNAASWVTPVSTAEVFQAPVAYPRIAPSGPPIPRLLFEKKLCNRPPPFLNPSLYSS